MWRQLARCVWPKDSSQALAQVEHRCGSKLVIAVTQLVGSDHLLRGYQNGLGALQDHVAEIRVDIRPVWIEVFDRPDGRAGCIPYHPVRLGPSTIAPEVLDMEGSSRTWRRGSRHDVQR